MPQPLASSAAIDDMEDILLHDDVLIQIDTDTPVSSSVAAVVKSQGPPSPPSTSTNQIASDDSNSSATFLPYYAPPVPPPKPRRKFKGHVGGSRKARKRLGSNHGHHGQHQRTQILPYLLLRLIQMRKTRCRCPCVTPRLCQYVNIQRVIVIRRSVSMALAIFVIVFTIVILIRRQPRSQLRHPKPTTKRCQYQLTCKELILYQSKISPIIQPQHSCQRTCADDHWI